MKIKRLKTWSVQGVKSLSHHFSCLCRWFEFYEVKKYFVIIFRKENGNTFTLFIIFIVKSLQKEQNSTNLLLWSPISRNKSAITPKWFNSLDTNSSAVSKIRMYMIFSGQILCMFCNSWKIELEKCYIKSIKRKWFLRLRIG